MNLASEPVRNRRLFVASLALLAAGIVLAAAAGASLFARAHGRLRAARAEVARLDKLEREARAEIRTRDKENTGFAQASKAEVDRINEVIERKAFSWVDFLSLLEEALPGPSYILSFSPLSTEKAAMEIRFKVASSDVGELVRFIQKLEALRFGPIRVLSQARGDAGELVSDIVVGYERRK
jgi:cell division protein FtsB